MKPIMYFKASPNEYCRITVGGTAKLEGKGIAKWILPFKTIVESVNTGLVNQPYSFPEMTKDNQAVTIQGSYLYGANDAKKVMDKFDCRIDITDKDRTQDFNEISEQITNTIRSAAKKYIQENKLEDILQQSEMLTTTITASLGSSKISELGLYVQTLYVNQITPNPEIAKALGAKYREELLTAENAATYARRAKAVEQEKEIKENELNNNIALEEHRTELINKQAGNAKIEGQFKAEVLEMELAVYKGMDPETLKAHALIELGKKAENLTTLAFGTGLIAQPGS